MQAEDKLFATLDPTTRVMDLDDGQLDPSDRYRRVYQKASSSSGGSL